MDAILRAGRVGVVWAAALAAGFIAQRIPMVGLGLGALGAGLGGWRRRLPGMAWLAAGGAVALAWAFPWLAFAQDPFHARPPASAWPLGAVAFATLGCGIAVWSWLPEGPRRSELPQVAVSAWERLSLLLSMGALALFLPISIAGTQIALAVAAATLLVAWSRGARSHLATPLDLPVALLLGAALLATALSAKPTSPLTTTALRALLSFFVVSRAAALVRPTDRELGSCLAIWAGASALVSLLAFSQHWTGFDAVAALGLRPPVQVLAPESPGHLAGIGAFASRLRFAHSTLLTAAVLLGTLLSGWARGWRRGGLWAALAVEAAGLWSTFARATWIAMALVTVAALALVGWLGNRTRALVAVATLGLAIALLLAVSPGTRARAHAGLTLSDNHDRLFLWARAAEVALDHPVVGVGFGSYHLVLDPYYDRFDPTFPMRTWAHDMSLSVLCETGPIGLFAFLWLLAAGLSLAAGALRSSTGNAASRALTLGAALATLAFGVVAAFHDVLYDGQVGYSLFFALGLAAWAAARLPSVSPSASARQSDTLR